MGYPLFTLPRNSRRLRILARKYANARPRLIYPETLDSEQIRELAKNPIHLLIWHSLFLGADDQGRMEARVSTIKASCLRHLPEGAIKDKVVQEALHRMRTIKDDDGVPLIYTYPTSADYPASGTLVLQFARWWVYQSGMTNAWPSRWPKPPAEIAPTWTDEVRGYGKKVFQKMVESGEISTDSGATVGPISQESAHLQVEGISRRKRVSNDTQGPKPFDLLAAYLDERGLPVADFPGMKVQLAEAKRMLADSFTPDEVRAAVRGFSADPYWSANGFDLGSIRRNWAKIKFAHEAPTKRRVARPITEDDS